MQTYVPGSTYNGLFHTRQGDGAALRIQHAARIIVVSDLHPYSTEEARDFANVVQALEADMIVTCGDNRRDGLAYATEVGSYWTKPLWAVPGNHDVDTDLSAFEAYFTHLPTNGASANRHSWMTSVNDCVKLFGLNTVASMGEDVVAGGDQDLWLRAASEAATEPWQFTFGHHAPYSNESAVYGPTTGMRWGYSAGASFEYINASFWGRMHQYERLLVGHKTFINVPPGSTNEALLTFATTTQAVTQLRERGFILIDANWGACTIYFINLDGRIRDQINFVR